MELTVEKRVELLESLVNELLKDSPEEEIISEKMQNLQIEYTSDKLLRINRVLEALHPFQALEFEEMI